MAHGEKKTLAATRAREIMAMAMAEDNGFEFLLDPVDRHLPDHAFNNSSRLR